MHISIKLAFLKSVEAFSRHLPYQIIDRSSGDVHIPSEKKPNVHTLMIGLSYITCVFL